jgi:triacylglycerol lipase
MRGARGIEFGVDLPGLPGIGRVGNVNGDGWGLKDWGRFVGAWKKEEKIQRDAAAASKTMGQGRMQVSLTEKDREQERAWQKAKDDAVIKSSTDKLSAVFDWLVEQMPLNLGTKGRVIADAEAGPGEEGNRSLEIRKKRSLKASELATKTDLEKFYVAMSRNLYDVGL